MCDILFQTVVFSPKYIQNESLSLVHQSKKQDYVIFKNLYTFCLEHKK